MLITTSVITYCFNNYIILIIFLIQEICFLFKILWVNIAVFSAFKFQTLVTVKQITKKYDDSVKTNRITSFGKI